MILTVLICTILEAIIVSSHINVYNDLRKLNLIDDPTTSINLGKTELDESKVSLGLRRLKNENVFFILLSLFQLVLGLDAVSKNFIFILIYG